MAEPPLLALRDVSLNLSGKVLAKGIDLSLSRGERICLIGANGSGKSSLMRILAGTLEADGGERFAQPGARIALLQQVPDFSRYASAEEAVLAGLPEDERFDIYRAEQALAAVDIAPSADPQRLSGGEQRRVALAQALVAQPDVLLLDEPTNHLDLPAIAWLEERLSDYPGALLVVSHDRALLSRLTNRIAWLERGTLRRHDKGFTVFDGWREEVLAQEAAAAHKLARHIDSELLWMREGLSARRTRNMGRVAKLMDARADHRERVSALRAGGQRAEIAVGSSGRASRNVLTARGLGVETPDGRRLLSDLDLMVQRGDRIGLIGPNGAGKTTLLRTLLGQQPAATGEVSMAPALRIVQLDQTRSMLTPGATMRQILLPQGGDTVHMPIGEGRTQPRHIAAYAQDFLFDTRRLDQPVDVFSGGERARLLFARLFLEPADLLVLDEPTNDLDLDTLDLLQEQLANFPGTLLLVSHDRDFLDRVVTATLLLDGKGRGTLYAGGFTDSLSQGAEPFAAAAERAGRPATAAAAKSAPAARPPREPSAPKLSYIEARELKALPDKIAKIETKVAALQDRLSDADLFARDAAGAMKLAAELEALQAEQAAAEERWLALEEKRELSGG